MTAVLEETLVGEIKKSNRTLDALCNQLASTDTEADADRLMQQLERPLPTAKVRLRGNVTRFVEEKRFGFISVPGMRDTGSGNDKQWHFHCNSVRKHAPIAAGSVVEFTPMPCPALGKRDKATDIEVVG